MSEFHRMITYLYLYEQGTKSRNVGFAKVERREHRCLLEIHMKNTGCSLSPVPVYFYAQRESQLAGILLGNFSLTRGSGDFKAILDAKNLKDSGYALDSVKGIYIPLTEEMMLVSQWDDDEFRPENFVDITKTGSDDSHASENTSSSQEPETPVSTRPKINSSPAREDAAVSPTPKTMNPEQAQEQANSSQPQKIANSSQSQRIANSSPAQEDAAVFPTPKNTNPEQAQEQTNPSQPQEQAVSTQTQEEPSPQHEETISLRQEKETPPAKPADALKAVEALPRPMEQNTSFHTVTGRASQTSRQNPRAAKFPGTEQSPEHSQADAPEDWDLRWRFILENYPVMTPFAGDEHTLCVRMELKDLRQLPKQFWYLGNNSFLLHGFFNYRYFILGMTEEFGVKKWFIGVPGVFQNPERVMAALFGFPEFRSEKKSPINTGEFGYWYRYLNELSEPADKEHS